MSRQVLAVLLAGLVVFNWGVVAVRADDSDAQSAKSAARAFFQALAEGDAATARANAIADDNQMKLIDAMAAWGQASKVMLASAVAKFGEAGKSLAAGGPTFDDEAAKSFENAEVTVDGDAARLAVGPEKQPVALKKANDQWKVDVAAMPNMPPSENVAKVLPTLAGVTKAALDTAKEIDDGKFKKADDAKLAFKDKVMAAVMATEEQARKKPQQ